MADILDQNEVDALLSGVSKGEIETETDKPSPVTEEMQYELTNPERVIRDKMTSLTVINDMFIKQFQNSMSVLLRKDVAVQVLETDVMKYSRFIDTLPLPASLSIMKVEPYQGVMIFEMDAKIVFSLMDILCGGTGYSRFKVEGRDFTSIEQRIIEKIVNQAANDLVVAWQTFVPLKIVLHKTEVNPRFVTAVEKNETMVIYTYDVEIEQINCSMKLCIPYSTIEPFRIQLSGEMGTDKVRKQVGKQNEWLRQGLREMAVNVVVEVGQGEVTLRDLLNLHVGDVLTLDKDLDDSFDIKFEGVKKYKGYPGQYKSKVAIQLSPSLDKGGK